MATQLQRQYQQQLEQEQPYKAQQQSRAPRKRITKAQKAAKIAKQLQRYAQKQKRAKKKQKRRRAITQRMVWAAKKRISKAQKAAGPASRVYLPPPPPLQSQPIRAIPTDGGIIRQVAVNTRNTEREDGGGGQKPQKGNSGGNSGRNSGGSGGKGSGGGGSGGGSAGGSGGGDGGDGDKGRGKGPTFWSKQKRAELRKERDEKEKEAPKNNKGKGKVGPKRRTGEKRKITGESRVPDGFDLADMMEKPWYGGYRYVEPKRDKWIVSAFNVNKPSLKRLARRAGVKRISSISLPPARDMLGQFVNTIVRDAITYTQHAKRKTVTVQDVLYALKRNWKTLYGASNGSQNTR